MAEELPVIRVDARAVTEVIYALIDNASKYSPTGTLITIEAHRAADDIVEIAVEDQGPGMPANVRTRAFEKFYRSPRDEATAGRRGIGMGLAIAKGIVEAHGGHIWIEDAESGQGARVVFTVPVGDDEFPLPLGEQ